MRWLDYGFVKVSLTSTQQRYRHKDFRGNVSFITNQNGTLVGSRLYGGYGVEAGAGVADDAFGFVERMEVGFRVPNSPAPPPLVLAGTIVNRLQSVMTNVRETPQVESVEVNIDLLPERREAEGAREDEEPRPHHDKGDWRKRIAELIVGDSGRLGATPEPSLRPRCGSNIICA